jgi:competence protein ComEC
MRDPSVGRRVIASAIWARGIYKLDHVILSHADADHYNGLLDLLERVRVGTVIVSEGFASAANPGALELLERVRARGIPVRSVVAGESWSSGSAHFAILHPPHGWNLSAPDNARSLVLDVSSLGYHVLLTGDLEGEGLTEFAASRPLEPIDTFLAPHHGGRAANPAWLYERISPVLVVVSQRPPQPGSKDSLDFLDDCGIPVMRTWRRGAVRMTWKESGIAARGFLDD